MLEKSGHIIAIDQVSAKAPFTGNGRPDSPLGLDKSWFDDKYQAKGDYITSADNTMVDKNLVLYNNQWKEAPSGTIYTNGPNIDVSKTGVISGRDWTPEFNATSAWANKKFQPSGKYITSAGNNLAGKALVLKDNQWVLANEAGGDIITINTFSSYSSFVNNNFITNSAFSSYSGIVNNNIINLTNIASSYSSYSSFYYNSYSAVSSYSSYWNDVYNSVYEYSSYWNSHSALSATKLDAADSAKFMQVAKLEYKGDKISGYAGSGFAFPDVPVYSGKDGIKVEDYWISVSAEYQPKGNYLSASDKYLSANALDNLSGKWEDVYNTVNDASGRWDAHSALSAEVNKKLNASESAKFMQTAKLEFTDDNRISGYNGSGFYVPAVHDYKGGNGIEITDDYIINISANYISASEYFLSANALDDVSGKWNSVYDIVDTYSGDWNAHSALSATKLDKTEFENISGRFVTSGDEISDENLAYVLKKTGDNVAWSGLDVSELGKKYIVSSSNNTIYVGSAQNGNTITYNLSADIPTIPGISGENGLSGYFDETANKYVVGVDERGLTYYKDSIGITSVTPLYNNVLPFELGSEAENITVEHGVFTLPDNVSKVTFSINELVEDNIFKTNDVVDHKFNLNKIALYCDNSEIISTQEYYHNELGLSELSLTYTIDNKRQGSNNYSIRYEGVPLTGEGRLSCRLSIIEEVLSLSEGGGSTGVNYTDIPNNLVHVDNINHEIYADDLSGISPIYVNNKKNIGLNYDELQFNTSGGKLEIDIHTTGGNIDQEAFEKLANIINSRMTETIPFGSLNNEASLPGARQYAYLFRPPMEYDLTSATQAYMFGGNGDGYVSVAVYEGKSYNAQLLWQSNYTQLPSANGGEVVMNYLANANTGTISPNNLYYACVRIHKLDGGAGSWSYVLGMKMNEYRTSVGELVPWCGVGSIDTLNYPTTYNFNSNAMADFGEHKPYIGFRTKDN